MDTIAKPTMTKEILERYGLKADKRFGQNFLIDPNTVEKIAMNACDEELVTIEIGPGIGSLTQYLARYSKKVYAHEIDKRLIEVLEDIFKDEEKIEIVPGDFLKCDLSLMPYHDAKINVCSNLPYYITTPVLFKIFESDLDIKKITVMVQKEVAERFVAKPDTEDYSALSVIVQYLFDTKLLMNVSRKVFDPMPKVDSAVVTFTPKVKDEDIVEKDFFDLIKASFKQRRKTLKNNLTSAYKGKDIDRLIAEAGLKATVRAQELTIEDFKHLYGGIYET